ncbi:nucleoside triphosphatase YtkD [Caldibacillus lycopersici]|uniref:Nucleoside triphosphatase YtkD n=1 Tax=Perspicuibacillus lycopersici TaxID=1325689 RepID=A0AAE3ITD7_9BACI|nr:nucleoside triphosphatase YtkD [Perspicuibacillus lycopersici]MCU9614288.1 nucleoside triphosphatase YtkD [Perspicuibacillus lycopersici]
METFHDINGNTIHLAFERDAFEIKAKHVWVICFYNGQWLLTKHKVRGLEFPGGKLECNETLEEAAIREVFEETGGIVTELHYIGQYKVIEKENEFLKNIYFANIHAINKNEQYFETDGPVLVSGNLTADELNEEYSFIMKDLVLQKCLAYIRKNLLNE